MNNLDNLFDKLIFKNTSAAVSEAYKTLRTNLLFARKDNSTTPVYLVNCPDFDLDKSIVSSNIAYSFANIGKKVLLVEGDMHLPGICKMFDVYSPERGIGALLSEKDKDYSKYVVKTEFDNIDILPSETTLDNACELLSFDALGELFELFKKDYDIVIVETASLVKFSDALLLAPFSDGTIIALKGEKTKSADVAATVKAIENINEKIIGFVYMQASKK